MFDSEDTSSDASTSTNKSLTAVQLSTFLRGEKITMELERCCKSYYTNNTSNILFTKYVRTLQTLYPNETITSHLQNATAVVSNVTVGLKSYYFTLYFRYRNQRDNLYDITRIQLKPTFSKPRGRLLVVFDFFSHSSDFFLYSRLIFRCC